MPSFNGIYSVRTGLDAARRALDIVGQNVANANTAGYSRQEVSFQAAEPQSALRAGRGISDTWVMRYRDDFLDRTYRTRAGSQGFYDSLNAQLSQVEPVVGDLSDTGLRTAVDKFFNTWDNLAQRPYDSAARANVIQAADAMVSMARSAFTDMMQLRTNVDEAMRNKVDDINAAATQLADLNRAIMQQELGKVHQANDLRDQRDRLLDSLARLAGTTSAEQDDGTVTVFLGSLQLVDKNFAHPINATAAMEPDLDPSAALVSTQQMLSTFTWNGMATVAPFTSGEMGGLLAVRDKAIPEFMKYVDNLMRTVATAVNNAHTAPDKFGAALLAPVLIFTDATGTAAPGAQWLDLVVNPVVKADPSKLLAGDTVPAAASDGERALRIARLRDSTMLTGAPVGSRQVTPAEYLRAISGVLGLQVQDAQRQSDAAGLQVSQAEKQRESVSGVSLDDEMTKMIQFQQTYNAAARVMTTMDEMLDTLVNRVGLSGR